MLNVERSMFDVHIHHSSLIPHSGFLIRHFHVGWAFDPRVSLAPRFTWGFQLAPAVKRGFLLREPPKSEAGRIKPADVL